MNTLLRSARGVACRLAVATGLSVLLTQAASAAVSGSLSLQPCRLQGLEQEASCGVLRRPLDPSRADGTQVDIHIAVIPALARNKKPDPVFFFAGGPGQSAIDLAPTIARLMVRVGNRRDLVLIDQRGTGRSAPLKCDEEAPTTPLRDLLDTARQARQITDCRMQLQALPHGDLRFYTTTVAMQDADAVRQALGAERVNLVGGSYGTRAVLEYQRQFPQRVRRAVIDGVAPPDMVLPAAFSGDNQAALDAVFRACEVEPACNARHPGLKGRWQAMLAALPREVVLMHPVTTVEEHVQLTRDAVVNLVRQPLYSPALTAGLPVVIDAATQGRFAGLVALGLSLGGGRRGVTLAQGMHLSVICAEDFPRMTGPNVPGPGADFGQVFADFYRRSCADWPRGEVPPAFYTVAPAGHATWVLSGGIDPVTPPSHGERVAKALGPKARHVVVANAGHGVMSIGCMRDQLFRFIDAERDDEALAVDVACVTGIPRPAAFALPRAASEGTR